MAFYTPLRYPGGKRRLFAFICKLLEANELENVQYVEPCAGGASLALALLYEGYASKIYINDLSRPVFAFWYAALHHTQFLCEKIEKTAITMDEWYRQRLIYEESESAELTELGFATFFLNRTNRSGIIGGGVIGGKQQTGKWKLSSRFTKEELIRRIRKVGDFRSRIYLYRQDALNFTNSTVEQLKGNTLIFYDPPYIERGKDLYLNNYALQDHRKLAERIQSLSQPWIVTYDYDAATRYGLFPTQRCLSFELSYSAQGRHYGREAMFLADCLELPREWETEESLSMSAAHSEYPVFGKLEKTTQGQAL